MVKVAVVGASGFTGGELLRILFMHRYVEVEVATSRTNAGEYLHTVHPNLRGLTMLRFELPNMDRLTKCDVVFLSTPAKVSSELTPKLLESGVKVIDLSPDFRLKDPSEYGRWYSWSHPHPELLEEAVYGLPELHRSEIRSARLVACPGCTATAAILGLAPLAKEKLIDGDHLIVDVKIGSSGAGLSRSLSSHHSERANVVRPYAPAGHRHVAEIEQELRRLGNPVKVGFSAHAVDMVRGILATCHVYPTRSLDIKDLWKIYRGFYRGEPFIRFVRDKKGLFRYPDPKAVVGSNFCDIGFDIDEHTGRVVVLSAIDNLVKGAAGSAVQCMNIMLGFDEVEGLRVPSLHPI